MVMQMTSLMVYMFLVVNSSDSHTYTLLYILAQTYSNLLRINESPIMGSGFPLRCIGLNAP